MIFIIRIKERRRGGKVLGVTIRTGLTPLSHLYLIVCMKKESIFDISYVILIIFIGKQCCCFPSNLQQLPATMNQCLIKENYFVSQKKTLTLLVLLMLWEHLLRRSTSSTLKIQIRMYYVYVNLSSIQLVHLKATYRGVVGRDSMGGTV